MISATSLWNWIKEKTGELLEWLKPDPADPAALQILKMPFKIVAVLLAAALSPLLLVVLVFAFVVAL